METIPQYLSPYQDLWEQNHKQGVLKWFSEANYGMFIHYNMSTLLHDNEWGMLNNAIPIDEYEKLTTHFTAHNFDADKIVDMAEAAGMKYITMVTCHHDGFCLWNSKIEPYNVMHTPCGRDLVREMSEACDRKGMGFFVYYTFMLNWHHPYFVDTTVFDVARPPYKTPEPRYLYRKKEDFKHYIDYIEAIMDELLSNYKVTGIWLDLIAAWYAMGYEYIPIDDIYENIRRKHPDVLISWKQGATGTEYFASPEHGFVDLTESIRARFGDAGAERARIGFARNKNKHNEICATVQNGAWGYNPRCGYKSVDELYNLLGHAQEHNCNLLLNVGFMADGSVDPLQRDIIFGLADRIKKEGISKQGRVSAVIKAAGAE